MIILISKKKIKELQDRLDEACKNDKTHSSKLSTN